MSIFGTTGICESFMPIFVLFAKDSVEWPETGNQGGDLPLQRGQKYRNSGKSAAPKRRGGQKAAVGLQRGKRLPKALPQKRRGKGVPFAECAQGNFAAKSGKNRLLAALPPLGVQKGRRRSGALPSACFCDFAASQFCPLLLRFRGPGGTFCA